MLNGLTACQTVNTVFEAVSKVIRSYLTDKGCPAQKKAFGAGGGPRPASVVIYKVNSKFLATNKLSLPINHASPVNKSSFWSVMNSNKRNNFDLSQARLSNFLGFRAAGRLLIFSIKLVYLPVLFGLAGCDSQKPPQSKTFRFDDSRLPSERAQLGKVMLSRLDEVVEISRFAILARETWSNGSTYGFPVTAAWHFACGLDGVEIDLGQETGDSIPDAIVQLSRAHFSAEECADITRLLVDHMMDHLAGPLRALR